MSEGHKKPSLKGGRRKKHWALRLLGWLLALFFLAVIGGAAVFFVGYRMTDIPDPNKDFQTETTFVYYGGKQSLGSFQEQNRLSVPLSTVPKYVQDAHIAAEDRTFWTNPGIEPTAMARAAWNISRGQELQGGSTITQQYVKLMYLNQERTVTRKFKELFIAIKLSRDDDKAKILEDYLNTIYYGRGAYGIRAAGIAFFGKQNPVELTSGESAFLATILNNPSLFDPDEPENATRILERYRYVLNGMQEMGAISAAQEAQLRKATPKLKPDPKGNKYAGPQGFLLAMAKKKLKDEAGFSEEEIAGGGLRVYTTFDFELQKKAVAAVKEHEQPTSKKNEKTPLHPAIASVNPQNGELVAMYAGPDYLDAKNQINWADRKALPGSSFKPFAVAAALKDGKSLRDRFQGDSPIYIGGKPYGNEFGQDYGQVNLLKATEESINTAFYDMVDNEMEDGPSKVVDAAEAAGIPKTEAIENDRSAPAVVLGPNTYASPIDMASAYATFAADGMHVGWHVIKEVRDITGKVVWKANVKPTKAFEQDVARDTSYALQKVVTDGTGRKNARKIDRPAAGKTGTAGGTASEHAKSKCKKCKQQDDTLTSWWVGYTPQLSTAVLYRAGADGQGDLDPFSDNKAFFGSEWPALTWQRFMKPAHEGLEELKFEDPSNKNREAKSPTPRPTADDTRETPIETERPTPPPSSSPPPPASTTPPSSPPPSSPPTKSPKPTKSPDPTRPPITITPPRQSESPRGDGGDG